MPLHKAASAGRLEAAQLLVAAKAPLDAKGDRGWGPTNIHLHAACPRHALRDFAFACGRCKRRILLGLLER